MYWNSQFFLTLLTSKCASRHNGVHFFDIWASTSDPKLKLFAHFYLEMCFAPQLCTLFPHLNLQRCSEPGVFCQFWFPNLLRATGKRAFSTSQLPRAPLFFKNIFASKCASPHNCAHFWDIWTSKRAPTLGCFSILTSKSASHHNGVQFFDLSSA